MWAGLRLGGLGIVGNLIFVLVRFSWVTLKGLLGTTHPEVLIVLC